MSKILRKCLNLKKSKYLVEIKTGSGKHKVVENKTGSGKQNRSNKKITSSGKQK